MLKLLLQVLWDKELIPTALRPFPHQPASQPIFSFSSLLCEATPRKQTMTDWGKHGLHL